MGDAFSVPFVLSWLQDLTVQLTDKVNNERDLLDKERQ